ncbi:hypothetical protein BDA96_10G333700 [Sorghum bicolor]|uniref:Uncharacterized protein n=1 Tax=Sorghum bicolor TaxID=4558 RepID=A0A921U317_SORBI|nr:hypothetical protein BDA96_10G333700 [Sorghum bicolor]
MKGRPAQPARADSGPNIGCVQRMSISSGSKPRRSLLGNSFTESTSAKRVSRRRRCSGSDRTTDSADRMEVARSTTSGWHSHRSCGSEKKSAPMDAAAAEWSDRECASTVCPCATSVRARNCPKVPNPTTAILSRGGG